MATQSIGEEAAGNPGMAINTEADNQPKVELEGNRGVELQIRSISPTEIEEDTYQSND